MPIHYAIDRARRVVHIEMSGAVGPIETLEFLERLAADPELRPAMAQLVDFRRVQAAPSLPDSEAVAQGFARLRYRFEGVRCAVLVSDPLMYGAIRQLALLAARAAVDVRPFVDVRGAQRWLGLPEEFE